MKKEKRPTLLTQDVVWTSIQRFLNVMGVKTTLCGYWDNKLITVRFRKKPTAVE